MTLTSFYFFAFLAMGGFVYYILPHKYQWIVLLILSVVFYLVSAAPYTILFLVISTAIAYVSTRFIEFHREAKYSKFITLAAIGGVVANVIVWFLLKGNSYWISISFFLHTHIPSVPVLPALPVASAMGMGYYTAQVVGYIVDVWWGTVPYQKNPLKLFLFVAFFPQLTLGPISKYSELAVLYKQHAFSYRNLCFGAQRILWGLFKKLVIADRLSPVINAIWADTVTYSGGYLWTAALLGPIAIYADFSGCMDIVLGTAEIFDIRLAENFNNPFFSRTCQEFWQRWHITLGRWAKEYIFYPVMKSDGMVSLGQKCRKRFGKRAAKLVPLSLSLGVMWFALGVWHGGFQYIFGVNLWFWLVIIIGKIFLPVNKIISERLHFKTQSFAWHLFQSLRTYIIYSIGIVFFSAAGLREGFKHFFMLFSFPIIGNAVPLSAAIEQLNISRYSILMITGGMVFLLAVGILRERYGYARIWIAEQSIAFRWLLWLGLFLTIILFGCYGPGYDASTFIYQGF